MTLWTRVARFSAKEVVRLNDADPEWYSKLLTDIAHGKSIADASLERVLSHVGVLHWIYDPGHPERLEAYYRALRIAAEHMVHECKDIADNGEDVGRDKLRIDTRLKIAGKWAPERYGEEKSSGSGGVTVIVQKFADEKVVVESGGGTLTVQ